MNQFRDLEKEIPSLQSASCKKSADLWIVKIEKRWANEEGRLYFYIGH